MSFLKTEELEPLFLKDADRELIGELDLCENPECKTCFYLESKSDSYRLVACVNEQVIEEYSVNSPKEVMKNLQAFKKAFVSKPVVHYGFDFVYKSEIEVSVTDTDIKENRVEDRIHKAIEKIACGEMKLKSTDDWQLKENGYHYFVAKVPIIASFYTETYGDKYDTCKKKAIEQFSNLCSSAFERTYRSVCEISEGELVGSDAESTFELIKDNVEGDFKLLLMTNMDNTGYTMLFNINPEHNLVRMSVYQCNEMIRPEYHRYSNENDKQMCSHLSGKCIEVQEFAIDRTKRKDLPSIYMIPAEINKYLLKAYCNKLLPFEKRRRSLRPIEME